MAPRQTEQQRRTGGGRRRAGASSQGHSADMAYGMAMAQVAAFNAGTRAGLVSSDPLTAQERAIATRFGHAAFVARLPGSEQDPEERAAMLRVTEQVLRRREEEQAARQHETEQAAARQHEEEHAAARLREEEHAARLREQEQAARLHSRDQATARQRAQQRAAAAAAEECRVMIRNIEAGDTGIPSRLERDMSWWSQDMLTYVDYAVPVYTLVPVIREDMCLFNRDDLATNELASRMISLPDQWDWSNGRGNLSDIVEYHLTACLVRLKELDDENDRDDQQRIAWARHPVYDPFSFLVMLKHPDEAKTILLVTLNDPRAQCYTDACLIPVEYAFDAIHALQRGKATWTGIKYLVASSAPQTPQWYTCMQLLRLEVAHYVNFLKPEHDRAREYDDDNDPDSPNTPDEELDVNATNLAEEVSTRRAARRKVRLYLESHYRWFAQRMHMPREVSYTPYTFLLFYLEPPKGSIRPVQREWVYEYVNFISRRSARIRTAFIHNTGHGPGQHNLPVANDGVLTSSEFVDRDWDWESLLREYPALMAEHVRRNSAVAQEFFLVWDHRNGGLLVCRVLEWKWRWVYSMTPDEIRAKVKLSRSRLSTARMLPEIDVVDYLRQVINQTGLVRPWPTQVPDLVTDREGDDDDDDDDDDDEDYQGMTAWKRDGVGMSFVCYAS